MLIDEISIIIPLDVSVYGNDFSQPKHGESRFCFKTNISNDFGSLLDYLLVPFGRHIASFSEATCIMFLYPTRF